MTEMFGEAWSPMSVPDLAPDDDDDDVMDSGNDTSVSHQKRMRIVITRIHACSLGKSYTLASPKH